MLLKSLCAAFALINAALGDQTTTLTSTRKTGVIRCTVYVSSTSVAIVPTTTLTTTLTPLTVRVTGTSTPSSIVTPTPVTVKSTIFQSITLTTTSDGGTETFTSTSTTLSFTTSVATLTSTSTVVNTVSSTSLIVSQIPAPPDFQGVDSSVNNNPPPPQRKRQVHTASHGDVMSSDTSNRIVGKKLLFHSNAQYANSVSCLLNLQSTITYTVLVIVPVVTVTLRPSTSTVRSTSVLTTTSTEMLNEVTQTITKVSTSTSTLKSTTSQTVVSTSDSTLLATKTVTSYLACATNNLFGPTDDNDNIVTNLEVADKSASSVLVSVNSPYDCCVSCLLSPLDCEIGAYSGLLNVCKLVVNPKTTHINPLYIAGDVVLNGPLKNYNITVFNGPNGVLSLSPSSSS